MVYLAVCPQLIIERYPPCSRVNAGGQARHINVSSPAHFGCNSLPYRRSQTSVCFTATIEKTKKPSHRLRVALPPRRSERRCDSIACEVIRIGSHFTQRSSCSKRTLKWSYTNIQHFDKALTRCHGWTIDVVCQNEAYME